MNILQAVILGAVQGLTEFIPVSSSGHLILAHNILGTVSASDLSFDAVLQLATVLAVLVYFWKDLFRLLKTFVSLIFLKPVEQKEKTLLHAIIIGTIPALLLGLLLESRMETVFRNASFVALALLLGSILMFFAEKYARTNFVKQNVTITKSRGFIIGLFQSLALFSGVSRSGATISGGLFSGLTRAEATRFSFLLSFPIIFGSGLKKLFDLSELGQLSSIGLPLVIASVVSFIVGLMSIKFLINYLKNHSLNIFVWYRIVLATVILLFL